MKALGLIALALGVNLALGVAPTRADSVEAIVRAQLAPQLAEGLGIDTVYVPRSLAKADLDPATAVVTTARALRPGRVSVRVIAGTGAAVYVPVTIVPVIDVAIARRALVPGDTILDSDIELVIRPASRAAAADLVIGARVTRPIGRDAIIDERDIALPAPLGRGAAVTIEIQRGGVHVRGAGVLELAARPGQPATARIGATRQVVHGVLVAPATVVVGGLP